MWNGLEAGFGIDLGTCNTLIYQEGKGIVLREPSVIAVRISTGEVAAVGNEAYAMLGRTPRDLKVVYPLQGGVIANYHMTSLMLRHFIGKLLGRRGRFLRSHAVISIPCGVTDVNRKAVEWSIVHKGMSRFETMEEPLAAAIGAGLPIADPVGSMLIDIGGGTTQTAILSLGGIVVSHTMGKGGMSIDRCIIEYVKKTHGLVIGERTAEQIKITAGTALLPSREECMEIRGSNVIDGLPKTVGFTSMEMYLLLNDFISDLIDSIRQTLELCPPELAGDVMERGIVLCGGGALLRGLGKRLQAETEIPFSVPDRPMECVALGAGSTLSPGRKLLFGRSDWDANKGTYGDNEYPLKGSVGNEQTDEQHGQPVEPLHEKSLAKN